LSGLPRSVPTTGEIVDNSEITFPQAGRRRSIFDSESKMFSGMSGLFCSMSLDGSSLICRNLNHAMHCIPTHLIHLTEKVNGEAQPRPENPRRIRRLGGRSCEPLVR